MSLKMLKKSFFLSLLLVSTLACSLFVPATPQPAATLESLYTAAAETLSVLSTQGPSGFTATPTLSISTAQSTPTPLAILTTAPATPKCDAAAFITDVTYPDGSVLARGNSFTKTWRIRNVGTCAWTTSYALVFVGGESFSGAKAVALPSGVGPGGSVEVSIPLTAPNQDGHYTGFWKLRNQSGVLFGFGGSGDASIYLDVNVKGFTVTKYDLALYLCDAVWKNGEKTLPCPGTNGSEDGFVVVLDGPKMEDGKAGEIGLLTHPQQIKNGVIRGKYPPIEIKSGDHFKASIGCLHQANDCNLLFQVEYQIENGPVQTLGQWQEIYEGESYAIDVDLSFLKGNNVKLILSVLANGSSHEDYALWGHPQITRQSAQPATLTPTPTLTLTATATETPSATPTQTTAP